MKTLSYIAILLGATSAVLANPLEKRCSPIGGSCTKATDCCAASCFNGVRLCNRTSNQCLCLTCFSELYQTVNTP
jgi:hypothetical protein